MLRGSALVLTVSLMTAFPALADKASITDVAGRTVEVEVPVDQVILGEGRLLYGVAALDTADPFKRVVGWRDDLKKNDPETYAAYRAKFPQADAIPTFGGVKEGTFDIEQAIALKPDVVVMNLEAKAATEDAGLIEKLEAVGIPLVYIDFRDAPIKNTEASMTILGTLLGEEPRAADFNAYRNAEIKRVTDVLDRSKPERPVVFLERAAGISDDCCMSFGSENFGLMVEMAGGTNAAAGLIPGAFGTVNPEQVIAANPDQVIVTGANWQIPSPGGMWVGVGPGADKAEAERKLKALVERPAYQGVKAVADGKVHAVWHQFYNSPYQFVVIQQMAKWLHPDLFADLDPEATFRTLHERFLPVPYQTGYFVSLGDGV